MKVIDLLNKIANGEEVPSKIKWNDFIYEKSKYNATPMGYYHRTNGGIKLWFLNDINDLNDEVEIIEEDKNIEKIKILNCDNYVKKGNYETILTMQEIALDIQTLKHKINEIIDKLEKE